MVQSFRTRACATVLFVLLSFLAGAFDAAAAEESAAASPEAYRVQPGDLLIMSVWREQDLQGEILVRPDGGISFPLVGDLRAGGRTIAELEKAVAERLLKFIPNPVVSIAVKVIGGNRIYVIGKVNRPGEYAFSRPIDVMQALALAGGTTSFAAVNDIRILRRDGGQLRTLTFRYAEVERGRELEQNVLLASGDTVVVP